MSAAIAVVDTIAAAPAAIQNLTLRIDFVLWPVRQKEASRLTTHAGDDGIKTLSGA
jgi:hypothetical protein